MGGSYGSVQVRTEDLKGVLASAEQVAAQLKIRMLVGPVINGWIGIYPESSDQQVGERFAQVLPEYVVEVLVHDDDVFAYWLYHDRNLIDSFFSRPGYFEEQNQAAEEAMTGKPQAFIPIAPNATAVLTRLLDRQSPRPTFEVETLLAFGKALGISNLATSYDYLADGERDGIEGWRKFVAIPQRAAREAAAAKRAKKRRIKADIALLKKSGVLLVQEQQSFLLVGGCSAGNGYLVSWMPNTLRQFNPPWDKPTTPALPTPPACMAPVTSDSNGRLIAIPTDKLEIWEWRDDAWRHHSDIATPGAPSKAVISPDGSRIACWIDNSLNVFDIESRNLLFQTQRIRATEAHIHPGGQWLVLDNRPVSLIPLAEAGEPRELGLAWGVEAEFEFHRKSLEDQFETMRTAAAGRPEAEQELAAHRARSDQMLAALRRHLTTSQRQLKENIYRIGLTPDGQWLWGHSRLGLLVFEWSALLNARGTELPPPKWKFNLSKSDEDSKARYFCGITSRPDSGSLIAGDSLGRLYVLDLKNGVSHSFFDHPAQRALHWLILSPDQRTLGVGSRGDSRHQIGDSVWEVFDYGKLQAGKCAG